MIDLRITERKRRMITAVMMDRADGLGQHASEADRMREALAAAEEEVRRLAIRECMVMVAMDKELASRDTERLLARMRKLAGER